MHISRLVTLPSAISRTAAAAMLVWALSGVGGASADSPERYHCVAKSPSLIGAFSDDTSPLGGSAPFYLEASVSSQSVTFFWNGKTLTRKTTKPEIVRRNEDSGLLLKTPDGAGMYLRNTINVTVTPKTATETEETEAFYSYSDKPIPGGSLGGEFTFDFSTGVASFAGRASGSPLASALSHAEYQCTSAKAEAAEEAKSAAAKADAERKAALLAKFNTQTPGYSPEQAMRIITGAENSPLRAAWAKDHYPCQKGKRVRLLVRPEKPSVIYTMDQGSMAPFPVADLGSHHILSDTPLRRSPPPNFNLYSNTPDEHYCAIDEPAIVGTVFAYVGDLDPY